MGDDWPDLPLLRRAAFACAPPHAHVEVRAVGAPRHRGRGRLRRGARVLRPAAGRRRALCGAAARPAVHARWRAMRSLPRRRATASMTTTVDLSFAGPEPVAAAPWPLRLLDVVSAYLPLLLMARAGARAPGGWCATRRRSSAPRAAAPPRHEPDYVMTQLRRPALRRRRRAAHPDRGRRGCATIPTPTRSRSTRRASAPSAATARVTAGQRADSALANGDGSEVQLLGDAHVIAAGARQGGRDRVPQRIPARLSQHRARALAPAGGRDAGRERGSRRRHGVRQPGPRGRSQGPRAARPSRRRRAAAP